MGDGKVLMTGYVCTACVSPPQARVYRSLENLRRAELCESVDGCGAARVEIRFLPLAEEEMCSEGRPVAGFQHMVKCLDLVKHGL